MSYSKKTIRKILKEIEESGSYKINYKKILELGSKVSTTQEFDKLIAKYVTIFKGFKKPSLTRYEKFRIAKTKTKDYREWIETCRSNDRSTGVLYLVLIYDDEEVFLKVGITTTSLERRFRDLPYQFKVLVTKEFSDVTELYLTEKWIHYRFNRARYIPMKHFVGYTECYKPSLEEKLIKEIND